MRRVLVVCVVLCSAAVFAAAGEPITIGETIIVQSEVMGEERTILVSTPPGYQQSTEAYPVLYMTDGDAHLTHTRGTVDFLARNGIMPQLIIVGVTNTDRTRDLTPTRVERREAGGRTVQFPTSGGAATFLDFFEKELFPLIESSYRTLPMRLFSGHSFGGLFALDAFFERPGMYRAVLSVSPSLDWDDDLPIRWAKKGLKENGNVNASLFVAMADEEADDPKPTRLDRLEEVFEKSDAGGFRWSVLRMPDENHGSVVLRAHYWGLREVFEGWRLPRDPETGGFAGSLKDLQDHYVGLSERFGFNVVPSENTVNAVGYQILFREAYDEAIAVFLSNVRLYPKSANVYDSLGEAYETAGLYEDALAAYTSAVENARANGDPRLAIFTENRDRARDRLDQAEPK